MAAREWLLTTQIPAAVASVKDYEVPGRGGAIHVRVYRPRASGKLPIIVYFHGGGWFFGSVAASDRSNQLLAAEARMMVVAVDYRLAPEFPYPAAWSDAQDAYAWVAEEANRLGGSPTDICVGGDSAGADLSIAVTRRRQAAGQPAPVCQLLYYPAPDDRPVDAMRRTYRSARLFGEGFGLDRSFMDYVLPAVFQHRDRQDPEISPLFAKCVAGLPPTFYAIAFFDPLRDSQRAYAARLVRAGDEVTFWEFPTLAHGFLQMTAVSPAARFAATQTARAFGAFARNAATVDAQANGP
jgi:acetyl esterase